MLKINLSEVSRETRQNPADIPAPEPRPEPKPAAAPRPDPKTKAKPAAPAPARQRGRGVWTAVAVIFLLAIFGAGIYFSRDSVVAFFAGEPEATLPQAVAPAPAPTSAPAAAAPAPEPVFTLLSSLSEVIPPRVWLTTLILRYDGSYELQGMAFAYPVMAVLDSALISLGAVTSRAYPPRSSSAETIYRFSVSGKAKGFAVPDILDLIPADTLAAYAAPVIKTSGKTGVTFAGAPQPGRTYRDQDLPFALVGSFAGVRQVIGDLYANDADIRVFQLEITPSEIGQPYDRVRARFSLRTKSSI